MRWIVCCPCVACGLLAFIAMIGYRRRRVTCAIVVCMVLAATPVVLTGVLRLACRCGVFGVARAIRL